MGSDSRTGSTPVAGTRFHIKNFILHRGVEQLVARRAHNPEVVGSNPSPATKSVTVVDTISATVTSFYARKTNALQLILGFSRIGRIFRRLRTYRQRSSPNAGRYIVCSIHAATVSCFPAHPLPLILPHKQRLVSSAACSLVIESLPSGQTLSREKADKSSNIKQGVLFPSIRLASGMF